MIFNFALQVSYVIAPRRDGDLPTIYGDASLAGTEMGWKATRDLEEMCKCDETFFGYFSQG